MGIMLIAYVPSFILSRTLSPGFFSKAASSASAGRKQRAPFPVSIQSGFIPLPRRSVSSHSAGIVPRRFASEMADWLMPKNLPNSHWVPHPVTAWMRSIADE